MAKHNDLGKTGESLGLRFLSKNGFLILHQNWKYSYYEIDLIASKNNVLHFIEIKTRQTRTFGHPEESAGKKKFAKLVKAAVRYLYQNPQWQRVQYDILSINLGENKAPEFFLIEDVYYW